MRPGRRAAPIPGIPFSKASRAGDAPATPNGGRRTGIKPTLAYPMRNVSWAAENSGIHGYASGIFYAILAANSVSTLLHGTIPRAIPLRRNSLRGRTVLWSEHGNECELIVLLSSADRAIAYVSQNPQWTTVLVGSLDEALAQDTLGDVSNALTPSALARPQLQMAFWYLGRFGASKAIREIDAVSWHDLSRNYPTTTRGRLDRLVTKFRPDMSSGRLFLFHGPPGTGKTFATRALARSWRDWCQCEYVVDPEALFSKSDYLVSVLLDRGGERAAEDGEAPERWRLHHT